MFRALACSCLNLFLFFFSEKLGINPKFLDSHQFHSCCCTGFQTLLCFLMPKSRKGHLRRLDYPPEIFWPKRGIILRTEIVWLAAGRRVLFVPAPCTPASPIWPLPAFLLSACNTFFSSASIFPHSQIRIDEVFKILP